MTQKEFIRKFEQICQTNCVNAIDTENWTCGVQMCYINHQDSEIANEFVEVIGFDADNCFYIDFCDGCTAYPWDLDCNCEDAWTCCGVQFLTTLNRIAPMTNTTSR